MVQPWISFLMKCKVALTLGMCFLFLSNLIFHSALLADICVWLVCAVLLFCLWQIRGVSRIIGYLLFITSGCLLGWYHAPLSVWMDGIERNIYMLVMFAFTPLMNIPLSKGGYSQALQNFLALFLERKSSFMMFISSLSALVGVILNVATIPLMLTIGSQQKENPDYKMLCTSVARGYAISILWGPTFAAVALPLELTGVKWVDYFPIAICISLFVLFSCYGYNCFQDWRKHPEWRQSARLSIRQKLLALPHADRRKLKELGGWWLVILTFIVIFSTLTGINTITVVSISSLFFPVLWMQAIHCFPIYKEEFLGNYLKKGLPGMNSEIVLFAGAGLVATAFDYSHTVDFIPSLLARLSGGQPLLFIILALGVIVALCVVGIHAMIPVIVLGSAIVPEVYGLTPLALTFILTSGWAMSVFLSSSATVSILIASFMHKDTFSVSVGWNWKYGLYVFMVYSMAIYIINQLGW